MRISKTMNIKLPYKFKPRPYQKEFYDEVFDYSTGKPIMIKKRWVIVRPRRHWKDKSIFNMLVIPEMMNRVWLYYYVFPEYWQARKAFWENIDNDWFSLLWHIPKDLIKNINNSEMKIELINWSILRVVGTDKNIDWVVWSNPIWIIFSEWALCNPLIWDYMRPMLMANDWWAFFVYTPRWHNHWYEVFQTANKFKDIRALSYKTAKETFDNDGNRIFTDKQLQEELDQWMDENLYNQEYMCSFEWALKWAIYWDQMKLAEEENRISSLPLEQWLNIYTFWDLWMSDTTVIWFVQFYGKEIRIVDHHEMSWKWFDYFVDILNQKGYVYTWHYLPHDWQIRELSANWLTRVQVLEKLWLRNVKVVPNVWIDTGISLTRKHFKNMWFDKVKCERGIDAIKSYTYEYDEKNKIRWRNPKHDRSSHSADALRYLGVMYEEITRLRKPQKSIVVDYSRFL